MVQKSSDTNKRRQWRKHPGFWQLRKDTWTPRFPEVNIWSPNFGRLSNIWQLKVQKFKISISCRKF